MGDTIIFSLKIHFQGRVVSYSNPSLFFQQRVIFYLVFKVKGCCYKSFLQQYLLDDQGQNCSFGCMEGFAVRTREAAKVFIQFCPQFRLCQFVFPFQLVFELVQLVVNVSRHIGGVDGCGSQGVFITNQILFNKEG